MSPLPRLHHDIMTVVGLFTYRQYVIYIRTIVLLPPPWHVAGSYINCNHFDFKSPKVTVVSGCEA